MICNFGAKILSTQQRDYSQFKREHWGGVTALKCDKEYLIGASVMVEIDCLPLLGIMLRWIAFIKSLSLDFSHIVRRDNAIANLLSRARFEDKDDMVVAHDDVDIKSFALSTLYANCRFKAHVLKAFLNDMYEENH